MPVELNTGLVVLTREVIALGIFLAAGPDRSVGTGISLDEGGRSPLSGSCLIRIADKLLVSAALISLVELGRVEAWMVVLIVSREFAVSALRNVALDQGITIAASDFGKAKMVAQVTASVTVATGPSVTSHRASRGISFSGWRSWSRSGRWSTTSWRSGTAPERWQRIEPDPDDAGVDSQERPGDWEPALAGQRAAQRELIQGGAQVAG